MKAAYKIAVSALIFLGAFSVNAHASAVNIHGNAEIKQLTNVSTAVNYKADKESREVADITKVFSALFKEKLSQYKVEIIDNSIKDIPEYSYCDKYVMGITDYSGKKVFIHENNHDWMTRHILYHEAGHVLDSLDKYSAIDYVGGDVYEFYSSSNDFSDIFKDEKNQMKDFSYEEYYTTDQSEYFAESFALYIDDGARLKRRAPRTYEFIDKVYKSVHKDNSGIAR